MAAIKSDIKSRPARWGAGFVAVLLLADLISVAAWMTFPSIKVQKTSASTTGNIEGASSQLLSLTEKLRASGAEVSIVNGPKVRRPPFSVSGVLVALRGDNIQVFEHGNRQRAIQEAEDFMDSYRQSSNRLSWMPLAHVYVDGSLVVLYAGNNPGIESILTSALGTPFGNK